MRDPDPDERIRLNALSMVGATAMEAHPRFHDDDRILVLTKNGVHGGVYLVGYGDDIVQVIADLVDHLQAVGETAGLPVGVVSVDLDDL